MKTNQRLRTNPSRRRFLKSVGAGVALFNIGPAHLLGGAGGSAPSDKLNVACVGIGGRGRASVEACANHNIVGLCDVDERQVGDARTKYPGAKFFTDFRKMFDALDKSIDAVTVGTPDHTHAVIALDAIRRGKHVYCEKPLAHSLAEIRALRKAALEKKVITQVGNQGHSSDSIRSFCEWIWDGAIGKVSEIHAFCDAFPNVYCQIDRLPEVTKKNEVPKELDYDLWLGPASFREYSPLWVPWNWRGWLPFGSGCMGDWVCHVVDPSFWAFDLGAPTSIRAEVTGYDPRLHGDCYPKGCRITFQFPAKGDRGPIKLTWFDGAERPPRPGALDQGENLPGTGAVVMGDKGVIVHGSHGAGGVHLVPASRMKDYKKPEPKIQRVPGQNHHGDWLEAIRAGRPAGSPFEYGGALTEIGLLGVVAVRFPGEELKWDAAQMRITNNERANALLTPDFRKGWTL